MPTTFRPYQPDQLLLLSPHLREWLPAGHLSITSATWSKHWT